MKQHLLPGKPGLKMNHIQCFISPVIAGGFPPSDVRYHYVRKASDFTLFNQGQLQDCHA